MIVGASYDAGNPTCVYLLVVGYNLSAVYTDGSARHNVVEVAVIWEESIRKISQTSVRGAGASL